MWARPRSVPVLIVALAVAACSAESGTETATPDETAATTTLAFAPLAGEYGGSLDGTRSFSGSISFVVVETRDQVADLRVLWELTSFDCGDGSSLDGVGADVPIGVTAALENGTFSLSDVTGTFISESAATGTVSGVIRAGAAECPFGPFEWTATLDGATADAGDTSAFDFAPACVIYDRITERSAATSVRDAPPEFWRRQRDDYMDLVTVVPDSIADDVGVVAGAWSDLYDLLHEYGLDFSAMAEARGIAAYTEIFDPDARAAEERVESLLSAKCD